jgi:hypothetical protein
MSTRTRYLVWALIGVSGLALVVGLVLVGLALDARGLMTISQGNGASLAVARTASDWAEGSALTSIPPGPSIDAYRGLGTWIDIYDERAWKDPAAAVRDMVRHGVRTIYVETGNSSSKSAFVNKAGVEAFIRLGHAHHMRVVAWYLPSTRHPWTDYDRIAETILLRTSDGQSFDSFALDIESNVVKSESERNRRLLWLSKKIRALAGPAYPLGAIIPSPVGLNKKRGYWNAFPYTALAREYDVFLPMSYYTYHGTGPLAAYADTLGSVNIIRDQKGCSQVPIHLIGGISEDSTPPEVRAFVQAANESSTCVGASLYGWPGTSAGQWQKLRALAK